MICVFESYLNQICFEEFFSSKIYLLATSAVYTQEPSIRTSKLQPSFHTSTTFFQYRKSSSSRTTLEMNQYEIQRFRLMDLPQELRDKVSVVQLFPTSSMSKECFTPF